MGRFSLRRSARWAALLLTFAAFVGGALPVSANHQVPGSGQSFTFLQAGFTQDLFGASPGFMGGVAFAPDGDPWVDVCAFSGSDLRRFDAQSTPPAVNGTSVHSVSSHPSNAGCGLTNHSGGDMYTNTGSGVVRLNASTGVQNGGPFGPDGNALGIAEDPETGNIIYVGSDSTLFLVNPALTTSGTFSTETTGNFLDGIAFDPSGDFLFVANRNPEFRLTILDGDTGALIQHVVMSSEPDGISFHATAPKFVITVNTDGTISRFDFPGDNYALPPVQSVFASGGFRGDLSQVGSDGCVYLTQDGTRYNDGTVTGENSLVRICGGFAPAPGVSSITLTPADDTNPTGTSHTVTAHVTSGGAPVTGQVVTFAVSGPNNGATGTCVPAGCATDSNGDVTFTYTGTNAGDDTITASFTDATGQLQSATAQKLWVTAAEPTNLTLTPETATNATGEQHCVIATVTDQSDNPMPGVPVDFVVTGVNPRFPPTTVPTDVNGEAEFCYTGTNVGGDTITATVHNASSSPPSDTATKTWIASAPFTLELAPTGVTNTVDAPHCLTATVEDQFGNPTPGITVRFSVTPTTFRTPSSGTDETNAAGVAEFCYTSALPGSDTIFAYADSDNDNVNDTPGEPEDTATKTWVLPASTAGCKVTNGGWIIAANGDRANFGGNAKATGLSGNENYQDKGPAADIHVKSSNVMAVRCSTDGTTASIFGKATVNGAGSFDYRIDVRDLGEPGTSDRYRIRLSTGYDSGDQVLSGGNIQIH